MRLIRQHGSYSSVCDGTTPGSPVLSDGHTIFTAGLSSTIAGVTLFRHEDALGSLRFLASSSQSVSAGQAKRQLWMRQLWIELDR